MATQLAEQSTLSKSEFIDQVINDYRTAYSSRIASLIGRKEVLTGKAKFGIFGDGKEIAQVAMARFMENGDFRAGYYRDQTLMFALGLSDTQKFFAQLYAHPDKEQEPSSAGRSMNGHFSTRMLDDEGNWLKQTDRINISSDISPTASQMQEYWVWPLHPKYTKAIKIYMPTPIFQNKEMKLLGERLAMQVRQKAIFGRV